ncbi:TIR domain-containing protein [Rhodococcus koreensis]
MSTAALWKASGQSLLELERRFVEDVFIDEATRDMFKGRAVSLSTEMFASNAAFPGRPALALIVSYAGPDRPGAQWMAGLLEESGFTVQLDDWDGAAVESAVHRTDRALQYAERVLAVWSPRYVDPASSPGEKVSAALYLNHDRPGRLVPVLIEGFPVHPLCRPRIHISVADRAEDEATRQLLDRLRGRTRRGHAHPFPGGMQPGVGRRFPRRAQPVWSVPARNPNFTGGDRMLEQLHTELAVTQTTVVHALHGMGGSGQRDSRSSTRTGSPPTKSSCGGSTPSSRHRSPDRFTEIAPHLGLPEGLPGPDSVTAVLRELDGAKGGCWSSTTPRTPGPCGPTGRRLPPAGCW